MAALPQSFMTLEEYFQLEESSEIRHEYYRGRVFAMAGASEKHTDIVSSIQFSLYGQTRQRNCKVRASDMRVGIKSIDFFAYPDVVIVCGKRELDNQLPNTLLNPTVLVEVLSRSTAEYDRGDKFEAYRMMASLQEYLLVSQNSVRVEHYVRQGEAWLFTETTRLEDTIILPSIDCTLLVSDIYEKVDFDDDNPT